MSAGLHSIDRFQVHISPVPLYYIVLKNNPLHYTIRRWYSECHVSYYVPISCMPTSLPPRQWLGTVCAVAMCIQWFSSFYVQMILYSLSTSGNLGDFLWRLDPGWIITGIHLILLVCPNFAWGGG